MYSVCPRPSPPRLFAPQHWRVPSVRIAQVLPNRATEIASACPLSSTLGGGNSADESPTKPVVAYPPAGAEPQHLTEPLVMSAHVCDSEASTWRAFSPVEPRDTLPGGMSPAALMGSSLPSPSR